MGGFPDGCDLRTASATGQVSYFDKYVYVSCALARLQVGLLPVGEIVQVWFHELLIGWYDPKESPHRIAGSSGRPVTSRCRPRRTRSSRSGGSRSIWPGLTESQMAGVTPRGRRPPNQRSATVQRLETRVATGLPLGGYRSELRTKSKRRGRAVTSP